MIRDRIHQIFTGPNELKVFKNILEHPGTTRNVIAKELHLSNSTIVNVVDRMIDNDFLVMSGSIQNKRGRNTALLDVNKSIIAAIGVHVSRRYVSVFLIDLEGKRLVVDHHKFDKTGWKPNLDIIDKSIAKQKSYAEENDLHLLGIGICTPGFVEFNKRALKFPDELYEWDKDCLQKRFETKFGIGTKISSVPSTTLSGEANFGVGKSYKDIVCIIISRNGIGWSYMKNRQVDQKVNHASRTFGQTSMGLDFGSANSSNIVTLEDLTGKKAIESYYSELLLSNDVAPTENSYETILKEASSGNYLALQAISKAASFLGFALSSLLTTLHPDLCILSGDMLEYNDMFFSLSTQIAKENILKITNDNIDFIRIFKDSPLTEVDAEGNVNYASAVGAATMVFEELTN